MAHQEHTSIKHFLAVYSNKGGVGKSTIAANLACGMAMRGFRVGLMDGDVHGPSMGLMMGNESHPEPFGESGYFPIEAHGVRVMSMANLVNEETPLIWRGARVHGALTQILNQTNWGELDIMVIDMPPGTGDAQLTLAQGLPFAGAIIVSTPQELSLLDTARGINAFRQLKVPVFGLVENMSFFVCDACGDENPLFGNSAGEIFCEEFDMPLLARIPIDPEICNAGDAGKPLVIDYPERPSGKALLNLTDTILMKLEESQTVQLFHVEWQDLGFLERRPTPPPSEPSGLSVNNVWQVSTDEFGIEFADGKVWIQSARNLRLECPCAACVNEWTHEKILKPEDVKPDLSIVAIQSVGRYALRFVFDDGHDSGLFHFDRLRKLADQTA